MIKWLSVYKDGTPNQDQRVLTYSGCYRGSPQLAFRLMDGQFVRLCEDITHYVYLQKLGEPQEEEGEQ